MTVLVLGANGATGRLVVSSLLSMGHMVRALVRKKSCGTYWDRHPQRENLNIIRGSALEMEDSGLEALTEGVHGVVSCLGHNLTLAGILLPPWKLVRNSLVRICRHLEARNQGVPLPRIILMSTTGVRIKKDDLPGSWGENILLALIDGLLPPQRDNIAAVRWLERSSEGQPGRIPWVTVRPDTLVDSSVISEYEIHPGTQRSPLLNPGITSRINVADFMARLSVEEELFQTWQYRCPVVYNSAG